MNGLEAFLENKLLMKNDADPLAPPSLAKITKWFDEKNQVRSWYQ